MTENSASEDDSNIGLSSQPESDDVTILKNKIIKLEKEIKKLDIQNDRIRQDKVYTNY